MQKLKCRKQTNSNCKTQTCSTSSTSPRPCLDAVLTFCEQSRSKAKHKPWAKQQRAAKSSNVSSKAHRRRGFVPKPGFGRPSGNFASKPLPKIFQGETAATETERNAITEPATHTISPHRSTQSLVSAVSFPAVTLRKASQRNLHGLPCKVTCDAYLVWRVLGLTLTWFDTCLTWHLLDLTLI